jgi:regulatory protein
MVFLKIQRIVVQLRESIYRYCNYQPRCHKEVRNKLYELGATTPEVEELIAELISNRILNEETYARAICRGKFRMKHWGKTRIIQQLRQNKISDYCIRKGLTEIDPLEYERKLRSLAEKKWLELKKEKSPAAKKGKLYRYMLQKGYEADLVQEVIRQLEANIAKSA